MSALYLKWLADAPDDLTIVMCAAPIGAFGGMAYTVGQFGGTLLASLGLLMATFWVTWGIFVSVVLGTSSSKTVLPRFLAKLDSAGASRRVVSLTVPTGYSFNLDGTCIYLAMAALFIAQAGGARLPLGAQLGLLGLMLLTGKGAAGVSGASLVTLAGSPQAFGPEFFPPEVLAIGIALVVGMDRVMSEGKALTSVIGIATGTMVAAKLAGGTRRRPVPRRARRPLAGARRDRAGDLRRRAGRPARAGPARGAGGGGS